MVSSTKIENFIKKFLQIMLPKDFEKVSEFSIHIAGWRAHPKYQVTLEISDSIKDLKLLKKHKLRLDVKKIHPTLSLFSGFRYNKISLVKSLNQKLRIGSTNGGIIFVAGDSNFKILKSLNIEFPINKSDTEIEKIICIDNLIISAETKNALYETLIYIVLNYRFLHHFLHKYIPNKILNQISDSLEPMNKLESVALFRSSLKINSCTPIQKNVRKLQYLVNSKTKSDLTPSAILMTSVSIYPENILVDSDDYLRNEISKDPKEHFCAHLSNYLYSNNSPNNEALIYTGNYEIVQIKEEVVYLPCNPTNNWFHLIFEGVFSLISNLEAIDFSKKIVIHQDSPKQFIELLQFIGFVHFYKLEKNTIYKVQSLFSFESSSQIIDSLANSQDLNHFSISETALLKTYTFLQKRIEVLNFMDESKFPEKILVLRVGATRGLINRKEIKSFCESMGFHSIYPEKEILTNQLLYFFNANEIILEGGAAMANLIFCRKGTKVIYLCSEMTSGYELISKICNLLELDLKVIAGKSENYFRNKANSIYGVYHSNYRIRPKSLCQFR